MSKLIIVMGASFRIKRDSVASTSQSTEKVFVHLFLPLYSGIPVCVWSGRTLDRRLLFSDHALLQYGVYESLSETPFTPELLDKIRAKGVETAFVALRVVLGTFRPVREENIFDSLQKRT